MDERMPILPPPPSLGLALRAALHALWFRLARAMGRLRLAVRARTRAPSPAPASLLLGPPGRGSPLLGSPAWIRATVRIGRPAIFTQRPGPLGDDRPTKVEGKRA